MDVSLVARSHEKFWLELINAEYASNREELKVAAIYMIDFKTSSKMTENLLNRGNWKCWIFIDARCKMPPCIWRITAFKLFLYKSWENDTLIISYFIICSFPLTYDVTMSVIELWQATIIGNVFSMLLIIYMMFVFLLHSLFLFLQTRY